MLLRLVYHLIRVGVFLVLKWLTDLGFLCDPFHLVFRVAAIGVRSLFHSSFNQVFKKLVFEIADLDILWRVRNKDS